MLTGLYPPSGGDALVLGHSLVSSMPRIRELIGVCPQDNVLFPELSIEEHLHLYGGIKGLSGDVLAARVNSMLDALGLQDKRHAWSRTLSGGQKRRLSVAVAAIGDPPVLYLDEPTSGLDPVARRQVWALIQKLRTNRVVILTTHFMDEADVLGDRIAIMARGRVRVCGTSLHLKHAFGLGYRLHFSGVAHNPCDEEDESLQEPTSDTHDGASRCRLMLAELVTKYVPSAEPIVVASRAVDANNDVYFQLPRSVVSTFPDLFDALDASCDRLGFQRYCVSIASLEDVYVRLAAVLESSASASHVPELAAADATRKVTRGVGLETVAADHGGVLSAVDASASTWLDVTRVAYESAASGHDARKLATTETAARGRYCTLRARKQIRAHVWRRCMEMGRDPRSMWLQWITPLLFVAAGVAFTLLRSVGSAPVAVAVAFTPNQFQGVLRAPSVNFSLPIFIDAASAHPAACVALATAIASNLPSTAGAPVPSVVSVAVTAAEVGAALIAAGDAAAAFFVNDATATAVNVTLIFNSTLTNGIPIMTSMLSSSLLSAALGGSAPKVVVTSAFAPFPLTQGDGESTAGNYLALGLLALAVAMGFNTVAAIQAVHVVEERESQAKQLQFIMGETPFAYWAATWIFDALQFLIPGTGTLIIVLVATGHDFRVSDSALLRLATMRLNALYAWFRVSRTAICISYARLAQQHNRNRTFACCVRHRAARADISGILCIRIARCCTDVCAPRFFSYYNRTLCDHFCARVPSTTRYVFKPARSTCRCALHWHVIPAIRASNWHCRRWHAK